MGNDLLYNLKDEYRKWMESNPTDDRFSIRVKVGTEDREAVERFVRDFTGTLSDHITVAPAQNDIVLFLRPEVRPLFLQALDKVEPSVVDRLREALKTVNKNGIYTVSGQSRDEDILRQFLQKHNIAGVTVVHTGGRLLVTVMDSERVAEALRQLQPSPKADVTPPEPVELLGERQREAHRRVMEITNLQLQTISQNVERVRQTPGIGSRAIDQLARFALTSGAIDQDTLGLLQRNNLVEDDGTVSLLIQDIVIAGARFDEHARQYYMDFDHIRKMRNDHWIKYMTDNLPWIPSEERVPLRAKFEMRAEDITHDGVPAGILQDFVRENKLKENDSVIYITSSSPSDLLQGVTNIRNGLIGQLEGKIVDPTLPEKELLRALDIGHLRRINDSGLDRLHIRIVLNSVIEDRIYMAGLPKGVSIARDELMRRMDRRLDNELGRDRPPGGRGPT